MRPARRRLLQALAAGAAGACTTAARADAIDDTVSPDRPLDFPRDHGAHAGTRIEWWYATGWLRAAPDAPPIGWQLTFFRSRTALAATLPGRFAPRQLLFAHAAISDIGARRHRDAQRVARWSGDAAQPEAHARSSDTDVVIGPWSLRRGADGRYAARLPAPEAGFTLALTLAPTQPLLLQGQRGHSRKGPLPQQASHYYSQPQLAAEARLQLDGRSRTLAGRGWLDHEWSNELMAPGVIGWDWIGINLHDGGALTAFVLRRADGSVVWAGGSHRGADGVLRIFGDHEVRFEPGREWLSPGSGARYPVEWTITTPAGRFALAALLDAQELDSSASTGAIYWEGLSALRDPATGRELGLGYLEMTGRKTALKLG
ncbi:lipocalin-like domain-containing protein [Aquabacterium humicola]|uniref:lipocalin-like domain-containing protein n=1 Tax=Aquabacterium humicola TaxID=3237377 RepID=UPI0025427546|nr:carotenoid 1,2-hydratase [Rubrivivax pictus]